MKANYQLATVPQSGVRVTIEGTLTRLLFDITPATPVDEDAPQADDLYNCESVDVNGRGYGDIVAAIVNDRYNSDSVQALLANKSLADDSESDISAEKRAEYLEEFATFQAWRAKAKQIATIAVSLMQ